MVKGFLNPPILGSGQRNKPLFADFFLPVPVSFTRPAGGDSSAVSSQPPISGRAGHVNFGVRGVGNSFGGLLTSFQAGQSGEVDSALGQRRARRADVSSFDSSALAANSRASIAGNLFVGRIARRFA